MTERKKNIEFIRIFAIFMTIMIHVSNYYINTFGEISSFDFCTSVAYNFLSRICVPLFFMVSGIFLINQEFEPKKYYTRIVKFTSILLVWSLVYYLFDNGFNFRNFPKVFASAFFNANQTSRHLWYMYALIGLYIALPFISNLCKNLSRQLENLFLILWLLLSGLDVVFVPLARYITNSNISVSYPIPLINATYYLGYFIAGHILYERLKDVKADKKKNIICILGYLLPTAISTVLTCVISSKTNEFYSPLTWYRSIFIVIASVSVFSLVVMNKEAFKSEIIGKLSKYSFGVYLIHMIVFDLLKGTVLMNILPLISIPLVTVIIYILSLLSSFILSKIKFLNNFV